MRLLAPVATDLIGGVTSPNSTWPEAARWCRARRARVIWSPDETRCRIEVPLPDGRGGRIDGEGADFLEAYAQCRDLVEAFFDDPPTRPFARR